MISIQYYQDMTAPGNSRFCFTGAGGAHLKLDRANSGISLDADEIASYSTIVLTIWSS